MSEKSCLNCKLYYSKGTSYCDAHNIVVNLDKNQHLTFAKECPDYTQKTTKQTCKNCVHYRDVDCECLLHHFTVYEPKYSATICAEFTPINTQKSEMNKFEKNLEMIADDLYELDNQRVPSEDLTLIPTMKSCEECIYHEFSHGYLNCKRHSCVIDDPLAFAKGCIDYTKKTKQQNPVNPSHYTQGKIACIDAIESATVNKNGLEAFAVGNVIKYLWRYEEKNGLEDVKKCQWYLNRLLEVLEDKDETD